MEKIRAAAKRLFPRQVLTYQEVILKIGEVDDDCGRRALIITGENFRFGILTHEQDGTPRDADEMVEEMDLRVLHGEYNRDSEQPRMMN